MKEKMKLTRVIVMGDEKMLHAELSMVLPDGDVSHGIKATVVLEYSENEAMDLTLNQIQTDARNRLPIDAWRG